MKTIAHLMTGSIVFLREACRLLYICILSRFVPGGGWVPSALNHVTVSAQAWGLCAAFCFLPHYELLAPPGPSAVSHKNSPHLYLSLFHPGIYLPPLNRLVSPALFGDTACCTVMSLENAPTTQSSCTSVS